MSAYQVTARAWIIVRAKNRDNAFARAAFSHGWVIGDNYEIEELDDDDVGGV